MTKHSSIRLIGDTRKYAREAHSSLNWPPEINNTSMNNYRNRGNKGGESLCAGACPVREFAIRELSS